jgi:acyl carrier protein
MSQAIDNQLKELLIDRLFLDYSPEEIDADTALAEYGVDSFLLQELIVGVEEAFGVQFAPSDYSAETLHSVASLRTWIVAKQSA